MPLDLLRVFETYDSPAYDGTYNWALVVLSMLIAILASGVALSIAERMAVTHSPRAKVAWASAGALSMGGGIWSMHFIGMIAFSLPCGVGYDPITTLASMVPGVLASGVALAIISRPHIRFWDKALGALLMGAGIGTMHYAGMAAMRPEALLRFDPLMVLVSVGVAVALAFAALDIRTRLSRLGVTGRARTIVSAVVMGCAIPGMHYTAMQAALFYPIAGLTVTAQSPQTMLALTVAGFGFLVGLSALTAAFAGEQRDVAKRLTEEIAQRELLEHDAIVGGARLQAIFDAVVDAIVTINAKGEIQQWSTGAQRIFGYSSDEVLGKNITMLMPDPHRSVHHQYVTAFQNTRQAKVIGSGRQLTAIRKDGSEFPIELAVSEVKAEGEQLFTGIMRDITDRKRAEEELILARVQAEEANAAKSLFLATMSHEIRTPMNGVLGMAGLLSNTPLNEQQSRLVSNLSRSGQTLLGIINDILDFSKIEAGKLDLRPVDFDPREVLADVADLFAERCSTKGLELVYYVSEEIPARVHADAARLRQVLVNLVGNAIKFTDHGEVLVELAATQIGDGQAMLGFSVRDSGIGIEADKVDRVFQSFEQVDNSMHRTRGGSGLGLAISRQLVELMGGQIGVESEFGRGSRFHFAIRCELVEGEIADARVNRRVDRQLRVLVVDTNEVSASVTTDYLTRWGVDPTVVRTLEGAAGLVAQDHFDTVLLDVKGLGAPAVEFGKSLRDGSGTDPAVVLLVGMDKLIADDSLTSAGAFALINKPVRPSELFECLTAIATQPQNAGVARFFVKRAAAPVMGRFSARLLVAEDNPVNQDVATGVLESMGCQVTIAANGLIATQMFAEEQFDLVLMDCEMPEMDGLEATRRIRQHEASGGPAAIDGVVRRTPIIALTAHALADVQLATQEAGMDDFLTKPFDERQINDALRRWIPQCETKAPMIDSVPVSAQAPVLAPKRPPVAEDASELPAIDRAAFDKVAAFRGPNGATLLRKVIGKFNESGPVLVETLGGAAEQGDVEALWRAAHSLKSSAAAVGAVRLSRRCVEIEALGRAGDLEGLRPFLGDLQSDLSDALGGLAELIGEADVRVA